jgi:hypothetical protein
MAKVILGGKEYPISATFGAIVAYLEMVGDDNPDGMATFAKLPPSKYPYLLAACVNQALLKAGSSESLSVDDIRECDFVEVSAAVAVVFTEMSPKNHQEPKKD